MSREQLAWLRYMEKQITCDELIAELEAIREELTLKALGSTGRCVDCMQGICTNKGHIQGIRNGND